MSEPQQIGASRAWPADRDGLAAEVERVARRLRGLTEARLRRPLPGYDTVADAGRQLASALAEAGQGVEERDLPGQPHWRSLPRLAVTAVGDQVAVTGHDLLAALAGVAADELVWTSTRRVEAGDLLAGTRRLANQIKLAIN